MTPSASVRTRRPVTEKMRTAKGPGAATDTATRSPEPGKTSVGGESVMLGPRAAQAMAMALNELATNATKYGALSTAAGTVSVVWTVALPMAVGNVLGNAFGARLALRRGDRLVRAMVILVSLALVVKLAIDLVRAR